jgi:hypothetical protein
MTGIVGFFSMGRCCTFMTRKKKSIFQCLELKNKQLHFLGKKRPILFNPEASLWIHMTTGNMEAEKHFLKFHI